MSMQVDTTLLFKKPYNPLILIYINRFHEAQAAQNLSPGVHNPFQDGKFYQLASFPQLIDK